MKVIFCFIEGLSLLSVAPWLPAGSFRTPGQPAAPRVGQALHGNVFGRYLTLANGAAVSCVATGWRDD